MCTGTLLSMIPRQLEAELLAQLAEFPVVTVLGPRQAGKTTLVRAALPGFGYVSLEDPEARQIADEGPRGYLVYNGDPHEFSDGIKAIPYTRMHEALT